MRVRKFSLEEAQMLRERGKVDLQPYLQVLGELEENWPYWIECEEGEKPSLLKRRLRKAAQLLDVDLHLGPVREGKFRLLLFKKA